MSEADKATFGPKSQGKKETPKEEKPKAKKPEAPKTKVLQGCHSKRRK